MTKRLVVDTDWLRETARRLEEVQQALGGEPLAVSRLGNQVGSRQLADALCDSSSSWSRQRERLVSSVQAAQRAAAQAADAFDGVDEDLVRSLRSAGPRR